MMINRDQLSINSGPDLDLIDYSVFRNLKDRISAAIFAPSIP